jgi:hypothetical protein
MCSALVKALVDRKMIAGGSHHNSNVAFYPMREAVSVAG